MNKKEFEDEIINSLASISHEMRTPINLIASTARLASMKLDCNNDTEAVKKYMDNIMNNCNKITMLISNIMDINMTLISKREFLNAKQFFDTFCDNIVPFCSETDTELNKEFETDRDLIDIHVDTTERILLNLITNAIKYNDKIKKKITIKMTVKENCVIFSVKDNGIGISNENIKKITEKFFRVDKSSTNGLGLGLSLIEKYLENMNGKMEIKSQLKKGTEVIVTIPITPEDRIYTAGDNEYIYQPEKSTFNIEFAQLTNL